MPTLPRSAYTKTAQTPVDLLAHLGNKGLVVDDIPAAIRALETIGYYRLLPYCRAFQDQTKRFGPGAAFEDVVKLYTFDRRLRLLCLDAIERIEVALRASINNRTAVDHGPHFYMDPRHFERFTAFQEFAGHAVKTKHRLTKQYGEKYCNPELPPIWVMTEVMSFGKISRLFADMKVDIRNKIAGDFTYAEGLLISWFRCLTDFRNRCAHHERIWNARMLTDQPSRAKALPELKEQDRFYARALLITALLRAVEPGEAWRDQFKGFIAAHPFVDPADMGFPSKWDRLPFWS